MNGSFQVKDLLLTAYYQKVLAILSHFKTVKLEHKVRSNNSRVDALSKLALGKGRGRYDSVILLTLSQPSVSVVGSVTNEPKKEDEHLDAKMTDKVTLMTVDKELGKDDWRRPIKDAIKSITDGDCVQDKTLTKRAVRYVMIGEDLYKRGFSTPLLKCLNQEQAEYVMNELHNGVCGMHCGQRALVARVIRVGYYWPTVRQNCSKYVKRRKSCQENGPLIHQTSTELHCIQSPWPFAKWGMDIVGPFPPTSGQRRFLVVAIDYFTKWIEAEPVAKITAANV